MWQEQKERCDMVDVGIKKVLAEKKFLQETPVITLRGKVLAEPSKAGGGVSFLSL